MLKRKSAKKPKMFTKEEESQSGAVQVNPKMPGCGADLSLIICDPAAKITSDPKPFIPNEYM